MSTLLIKRLGLTFMLFGFSVAFAGTLPVQHYKVTSKPSATLNVNMGLNANDTIIKESDTMLAIVKGQKKSYSMTDAVEWAGNQQKVIVDSIAVARAKRRGVSQFGEGINQLVIQTSNGTVKTYSNPNCSLMVSAVTPSVHTLTVVWNADHSNYECHYS